MPDQSSGGPPLIVERLDGPGVFVFELSEVSTARLAKASKLLLLASAVNAITSVMVLFHIAREYLT